MLDECQLLAIDVRPKGGRFYGRTGKNVAEFATVRCFAPEFWSQNVKLTGAVRAPAPKAAARPVERLVVPASV